MTTDENGQEIKTDVDVFTDASAISMDDGDLKTGVKKMIDDRIGQAEFAKREEVEEIAKKLGGGNVRFVDELPEKGEEGVLYLINKTVQNASGGPSDCIKMYIFDNEKRVFRNLSSFADAVEMDEAILQVLTGWVSRDTLERIHQIARECVEEFYKENHTQTFKILSKAEYEALDLSKKGDANNIFFIKE